MVVKLPGQSAACGWSLLTVARLSPAEITPASAHSGSSQCRLIQILDSHLTYPSVEERLTPVQLCVSTLIK